MCGKAGLRADPSKSAALDVEKYLRRIAVIGFKKGVAKDKHPCLDVLPSNRGESKRYQEWRDVHGGRFIFLAHGIMLAIMAKAPKKEPSVEDVELVPDAWPRFEKFVRDIAKAKPKHKTGTDTAHAVSKEKAKPKT